MKNSFKFLFAAILVFVTVNASAQIGVKVGYVNSGSSFNVKAEGMSLNLDPDRQNGFYAGVNYDISLPVKGLSLRPGITYTYVGGRSLLGSALGGILGGLGEEEPGFEMPELDFKDRDHTLSIPIDVKYAFSFGDFKVYAFAGPRLAVGIASTMTMKQDGASVSANYYNGKVTTIVDGEKETEDGEDGGVYSRFDVQVGAGAGVQYKKLSLELGYDWGLLNRAKGDAAENITIKRSQFVVGVGFTF